MKIFFDVEFYENGKTIDLVSIGLVREDSAELYLESSEYDKTQTTPWLEGNVLPHLLGGKCIRTKAEIAKEIVNFVGHSPEFWAYYADYDWVCLCQLYGTMMDLPESWPMFCMDLRQLCSHVGEQKLPAQTSVEHNALNDAIWNKAAYSFLMSYYHA
jgi:hypothetical protein